MTETGEVIPNPWIKHGETEARVESEQQAASVLAPRNGPPPSPPKNQALPFILGTARLAAMLGQTENLAPKIWVREGRPLEIVGVLDRCDADSISHPGKKYPMVRLPGGWHHADLGCEGWIIRGHCHHTDELNEGDK